MLRCRASGWVIALVAVIFLATAVPCHADGHEQRARKFIETMADKAIAALAEDHITREEQVRRFRALLNEHFAVKTIGRWVLGRYWRKATKKERGEYLTLFEELIVATYVDRFTKYSGETLSVVSTAPKGKKDTMVFSHIKRLDGDPPLKVNWRVRMLKGGHRIVDVMVEGISMGQTQRSEFASVIRKNGGKIEGLLSELRERAKLDV
jgi:phospholipid transport system substrate-binding protein